MRLLTLAAFCFAIAAPAQNQGLVLANGTTGHLDVPYSPTLTPRGGITVEAWVTYNSVLGTGWRFPTIVRMDPTPNTGSYFLRVEAGNTLSNRLRWWVGTTNGTFAIDWFFPAGTLANWTHLAGTYDGSTLRIFANGVQVVQGAASGALLDTNGALRIGSGDLTIVGGETWNGELDEVRVWPVARSAAAIASTMNLRLSTIPGEVSTWNLDGDALDSSGNNHGAAFGAAAFAPNSLVQQLVASPGLFAFGNASGCTPTGLAVPVALANVGNAGFGFAGTRGPASSIGLLLVSLAALPVPVNVLGIDVFVDPGAGVLLTALATPLGTSQVPFAIPADPMLSGVALYSQFAWLDGSCAAGFSASDAMLSLVIP